MDLHNPHRRGDGRSTRPSRDGRKTWAPTRADESTDVTPRRAAMRQRLDALAGQNPLLRVDGLVASYGVKEILRGIDLRLGAGQVLCLIGPNGAGKSTVLHSIFGLTDIRAGRIEVAGRNVTRLGPNAKRRDAGIAYVLQDSSVFPDMTVEQNLWLGGYLMGRRTDARQAAERVFERYPSLARRRDDLARVLSGGERRLLEIARALVMRPHLLLVDEPSIGLEPFYVEQVFDLLRDRSREGLTIVMAEQNAKRGLEVADIGCVVVAGEIALAGTGAELLRDPTVTPLFSSAVRSLDLNANRGSDLASARSARRS
jgi:branched-chain amino acid transport system ATP-binding protein